MNKPIESSNGGFNLEGSHVLVIGGSGLIGSHTVEALLREKVGKVIILDKFINERNLSAVLPSRKIQIIHGEVGDSETLRNVLKGSDFVYHFAASTFAVGGQKNPKLILDDINGFFGLLVMLGEYSIKKLIFTSSSAVYGAPENPELPMVEETPFRGRNMYAAGKIAGEMFCRVFKDLYGLNYLILRYSSAYGPRLHNLGYSSQIIMRTLDAINQRQPLEVEEGEESELQDYIYVGDVAKANILAMKSPVSDCAINIAAGESVNMLEVAKIVMQIKGTEIPIKIIPRRKLVSTPTRRFSGEKAAELLNFRASTPLAEGLRQLIHWYETQG